METKYIKDNRNNWPIQLHPHVRSSVKDRWHDKNIRERGCIAIKYNESNPLVFQETIYEP
jgi:hypothetical protein